MYCTTEKKLANEHRCNQIDLIKIREYWQPLADKELSENDCKNICGDISLFFSALCRMNAELNEIQKRKIKGDKNYV